jgi:hypothetical protein
VLWVEAEDTELDCVLECVVTDEIELRLDALEGTGGGTEVTDSEATEPVTEPAREPARELPADSDLTEECLEDSYLGAECLEDSGLGKDCLDESGLAKDRFEDSDLGIECLEESLFATEPLADSVFCIERADVDLATERLGSEGRDLSYICGRETPRPRVLNVDWSGGKGSP